MPGGQRPLKTTDFFAQGNRSDRSDTSDTSEPKSHGYRIRISSTTASRGHAPTGLVPHGRSSPCHAKGNAIWPPCFPCGHRHKATANRSCPVHGLLLHGALVLRVSSLGLAQEVPRNGLADFLERNVGWVAVEWVVQFVADQFNRQNQVRHGHRHQRSPPT